MANITRRTHQRNDGKTSVYWQARHRAPDGREVSKQFARKVDAERWLITQAAAVIKGDWTDPARGKVPFADYCC